MNKIIGILFLCTLFSHNAMAVGGTGACNGTYKGNKITLNATMLNVLKMDSGTASVTVNGRIVAKFDGGDMKINLLMRTFKITNGQGDEATGKLNNLETKTGILKILRIPAYGIDYRDVIVSCWSKKG